jgi:hypothetical protein
MRRRKLDIEALANQENLCEAVLTAHDCARLRTAASGTERNSRIVHRNAAEKCKSPQ